MTANPEASPFEGTSVPWIEPTTYLKLLELRKKYQCPRDMLADAAEVFTGAYDVPSLCFEHPEKLVILDIGANCGAYAVWAADRWPGAKIHCYEPQPEALEYLIKNTQALAPRVECHSTAITSHSTVGVKRLFLGKHNLGEASFHHLGCQSEESILVDTLAAGVLPDCDILKVDTEGSEFVILPHFFGLSIHEASLLSNAVEQTSLSARTASLTTKQVDELSQQISKLSQKMQVKRRSAPSLISFEFHRESDRVILDRFLLALGYVLMRGSIRSPMLGVVNYVHSSGIIRKDEQP